MNVLPSQFGPCAEGFAHDSSFQQLHPMEEFRNGRSFTVVSRIVMRTSSFNKCSWAILAAGIVLLPGGRSDAGDDSPKKVVVCHKGNTLEVAESALQAHLNHGDSLGACNISPDQNR